MSPHRRTHQRIRTPPNGRRSRLRFTAGPMPRFVRLMAIAIVLIGCGQKEHETGRTNVVLISIDTLRADRLGCYGYERPTSVGLDAFAANGTIFEQCAATSPWTLPSHTSMLTGLYPSRHGLQEYPNPNGEHPMLPESCTTLAQVLKAQGFSTAAIVNSRWVSREYGLDRGFEHFDYVDETVDQAEPSDIANRAVDWLSAADDKPFFLFLHWYDLHSDYTSLPEFEQRFVGPYQGRADGTTAQMRDVNRRKAAPFDDRDAKHLIDLYDASICQLDEQIGRVVDHLQMSGLIDQTIIVITSDHGEEFLEHGHLMHGKFHFEEVIRVPLIVRGPDVPRNRRIGHPVSLVDIMPTVLGCLGIDTPDVQDGVDLRSLWTENDADPAQRAVFSEADHWNSAVTVRNARYKLYYSRWTRNTKVYDLLNDPGEHTAITAQGVSSIVSLQDQVDQFVQINPTEAATGRMTPKAMEHLKSLGYAW